MFKRENLLYILLLSIIILNLIVIFILVNKKTRCPEPYYPKDYRALYPTNKDIDQYSRYRMSNNFFYI